MTAPWRDDDLARRVENWFEQQAADSRVDVPAMIESSRSLGQRRRRRRRLAVASTIFALVAMAGVLTVAIPKTLLLSPPQPAAQSTPASPLVFAPFGQSKAAFDWNASGDQLTITPPLGDNLYSALWGVSTGTPSCAATVAFNVRMKPTPGIVNYGIAVAPRSRIVSDQPNGASVQYEHEGPPDFPQAGFFVRPAQLPGGAWTVEETPRRAPDLTRTQHIVVVATGTRLGIMVNGDSVATYSQSSECGVVSIRVWGASASFSSIEISRP